MLIIRNHVKKCDNKNRKDLWAGWQGWQVDGVTGDWDDMDEGDAGVGR